jgi:hypothetical protein
MAEENININNDFENMPQNTDVNQDITQAMSGDKTAEDTTVENTMASEYKQTADDIIASDQEEGDLPKEPDPVYSSRDDLLNRYKTSRKKEDSVDGEDSVSQIEHLRQEFKNWGMKFAGSAIQNSTFVVNNMTYKENLKEDAKKNLLGETNEGELLTWCSEHYQDFHFAMFLAICILDRQPYQMIYQMARELHKIFVAGIKKENDGKEDKIFKSQISEVLGIIGYTDLVYVRGVMTEVDFLRLPLHEQAEQYIQLMVKEFPELKYTLSDYLVKKVISVYGSRHNYIIISGCMEALAFIASSDLPFFNEQVIPRFLHQKMAGIDFCLAVLLGKLYNKSGCKSFVKACVVQWGQLKNNPHCSLAALYVCSMLGKQENLVRDIWTRILDRLIEELTEESDVGESYFDILQEFFNSGNRNISYHKGVIHAFYMRISIAEKELERDHWDLLNLIFLLFIVEDYDNCNISESKPDNEQDMIWIRIFQKLDKKTGQELTELWYLALDNRMCPKEVWDLLEDYLAKYKNYKNDDIERLAFFFYHINQRMGRNRGLLFLKECSKRSPHSIQIAEQIYNRIKG